MPANVLSHSHFILCVRMCFIVVVVSRGERVSCHRRCSLQLLLFFLLNPFCAFLPIQTSIYHNNNNNVLTKNEATAVAAMTTPGGAASGHVGHAIEHAQRTYVRTHLAARASHVSEVYIKMKIRLFWHRFSWVAAASLCAARLLILIVVVHSSSCSAPYAIHHKWTNTSI